MLKKVETKCKRCKSEFCKKRTEQEFFQRNAGTRRGKSLEKNRLKGTPRGSVANGPFSSIRTDACKAPSTPDLGAFIRAQIVAQEELNPISFSLSDGTKGRVWLASDWDHSKIIGDDRLWRVNAEELLRQRERRPKAISWLPTAEVLRRPIIVVGRNNSVRDIDDALQTMKGFKLRICIEGEKELQILGCGWRIVTCQFRGDKVLLHYNGSVAAMKRKAFKELLAAVRAVRAKKRRPSLRLVVSNPAPSVLNAEAA